MLPKIEGNNTTGNGRNEVELQDAAPKTKYTVNCHKCGNVLKTDDSPDMITECRNCGSENIETFQN